MKLESEIFARLRPDFARFPAAGFVYDGENSVWRARLELQGGAFYADVTVSDGGEVSGRVCDADSGDEYLAVHIPSQTGSFVASVRLAYRDALLQAARACFVPHVFVSEQANRVAALIADELGVLVEEPWGGGEGAVFRDRNTRKWFAVVLSIPREKIVPGASGDVEIMNVKAPEAEVPALLRERGIYRCYHMNKKHWVTMTLDDVLTDERIMRLVRESARFAARGSAKTSAPGTIPNAWIVPANFTYWDVEKHFDENPVHTWKQTSSVRPGDFVFLYVSAPVSAIWCKCRVLETNIPADYADENVTMKKVMRIRMIRRYGRDLITLETMRRCGVRAVRGARRMTAELMAEIGRLEGQKNGKSSARGARKTSKATDSP